MQRTASKSACFRCVAMMDVSGFQTRLSRASVNKIAADIDSLITAFPKQQIWSVSAPGGPYTSGCDHSQAAV